MSVEGIAENLVADIIFIICVGLIGWIWITVSRRRKLQRFFGIQQSKRIVISLSNLRVLTFGAIGISGRKMSYQGSAVAYGEMRAAMQLRRLFSFVVPVIEDSAEFLRRLLIADVSVDMFISPLTKKDLEAKGSYITLGSPAYNIALKEAEDTNGKSRFQFGVLRKKEVEEKPFEVRPTAYSTDTESVYMSGSTVSLSPSMVGDRGESFDEEDKKSAILIEGIPPFVDPHNAFIQRTVDEDLERTIFYVAGLSEHSTEGAANYLVSEWQKLYKKYGKDTSFLVVLSISSETVSSWTILFDKVIETGS